MIKDSKILNRRDFCLGWISTVVPTYNRSDFLLNALESIRQQSYRPIEIVVVDDGSTDDTIRVIRKWAKQYNEPKTFVIRWIVQSNQGANAARNRGIEESHGEFIAFLDSDDQWLPEKLAMQISIMQKNADIGGVYCGMRNVDLVTGEKEKFSPRAYPEGDLLRQLLIHDVTEATSAWVVRKECFNQVGMFDISLPARQDWDMWIRLSEKYMIGCAPEILVELGNHPGDRVRSKAHREIDAHQTIFRKYAYLRAKFPFWVSLTARSAMYRRRGRVYFHRGISRKKAFAMYLSAILVWPFDFDSYAALTGMMLTDEFRRKIRFFWNRIFGKTRLAIKTH
ncbi:MAG: glycosyltransferase family 2 protein [Desulfobacteraceae bacterium]|nr:glycosyltransferase family 2 protein [Desulfobacteraceae bacterium]MBC2757659.1 glycosyltransferase family 2 protein [Desulfobacteraceae bacterium]MBC2763904.1 glycosyltransferase family 2 protein [ANME-2 cluster archaeon]